MPLLDREIATYERLRDSLEAKHCLKWAVIHGETYVGAYPTFDDALQEAVCRFLDTDILPERIRDSPPGRARRGNSVGSESVRRRVHSHQVGRRGAHDSEADEAPPRSNTRFPHYRRAGRERAASSTTRSDPRFPDYHSGSR